MPRPLLPPRGLFLPTGLLFDDQVTPSLLHTWAQLRALAWGRQETPVLSILQVCELTGKSSSTLYGHMTALRNRDALRWRPAGRGNLIVSFPQELDPPPDLEPDPLSRNLEKPSLNLPPQSSDLNLQEDLRGHALQKPGKSLQKSGKPLADPVQVYRSIAGISPNQAQRAHIQTAVTDLPAWQATLDHWLSHRWNPRNLPGMLDLYSRGGPSACRHCQKSAPLSQTLALLDQIRQEYSDASP